MRGTPCALLCIPESPIGSLEDEAILERSSGEFEFHFLKLKPPSNIACLVITRIGPECFFNSTSSGY